MRLSYEILKKISEKYGESFYILNSRQFTENYKELNKAFNDIYPNTHIAYSYKTNYTPKLCKIINNLGGFAEVVSDMEYRIALKVGVAPKNIYFNGPYKNYSAVEELLITGGTVNIDSDFDLNLVKQVARMHPDSILSVGLRCNFDVHDGVVSRFGFSVDGIEFNSAIQTLRKISNIRIKGLHCHFATRALETWPHRVEGILRVVATYFNEPLTFISLGGGLYGKMDDSLKAQFDVDIPTYEDYAKVVTIKFKEYFSNISPAELPMLIIEPGTALVGDSMKFAAIVTSIKDIRGKKIAIVQGSIYNINPTLNKKNPPITVFHDSISKSLQAQYENLDFGGYTCIESDYLYRGYNGRLAVSDYVLFDNVGSYSIVLKPPFIQPNFAIVDYNDNTGNIELIKRREDFDDLLNTYQF